MNQTSAFTWGGRCLVGIALLALHTFGVPALLAATTHLLPGHVPSVVTRMVPTGRLDASQRLNLAIGLPLRNRTALTNLLHDLYDPTNPRFGQYLTPEQFTESFGPTTDEYQSVVAFAESNGFIVTGTHKNRALLDVKASVSDIERAFHITFQTYDHPTEHRIFFAPNTEPSIDSAVPILDISGLDDFTLPRPLLHKLAANNLRPAFGSGPGGTYRGNDFRAAYAPGIAANGFGQSVALLEFDGYYLNDITAYETAAGLPNVPLTNVLLDGFNGSPGGANIEVALDIEVAIAMAPGLSQVIVYEAGPTGFPNDILSRMVSDNLAKQISSSWTWSGSPTSDSFFQQMAAQGQSFFQASGDSDAYTSTIPQPADSPYITVVGGTTLSTSGPGGSWTSETTWNWFNNGSGTNGSSGGISTVYSIPSWQQPVSMSGNQGSTTLRNIPDVALTADNVWVTYNNGGSGGVGGTSCAAPLWAGFMALMNQQALANGKQPVGFLNPSLYNVGTGAGYGTSFHDITTGNNTNKSSPGKFFAVAGYDLCTGWGTPKVGLINALAGPATPEILSNSLVLVAETCANSAVDPGETVTLNFGLVNAGSANTTNLIATLQASGGILSPSGPQSYGVVTAGGATVIRPFTFTATGNCGGTITATLQLQDGVSSLGSVAFVIRLGAPSTPITLSQTFDAVAPPALPAGWPSAVSSGTAANWVTSNGAADTAPNSAFAADSAVAGQTELLSPIVQVLSSSAVLSFRHNYNLATHLAGHPKVTFYDDGGVLLISIGGGPFTDILAAGGNFLAGSYNCTLGTGTGNTLAGASAWGGSSSGWTSTTVAVPAAAAGQNVQFKWALGTDTNSAPAVGWFVDSISLQDNSFDCCSPSADMGATQSVVPNPGSVGQNLVYTLRITNAGPSSAANVTVTDSLPSSVTFVSASPGCINLGSSIACLVGALPSGGVSNILITVSPTAPGTATNMVQVSATTADPNAANNVSTATTSVYIPPSISTQPTNQMVTVGGNTAFSVLANGSPPLSYQWKLNGTAVPGATSSNLILLNVQTNQVGSYTAVVSNPAGSVTSAVATLTVLVPPAILAQPTNQIAVLGGNASFQASANGTAPLAYQWRFNGVAIPGATSTTVLLTNVQTNQAGGYTLVITNTAGSVTSQVASLTILVPPSITQQPVNQTVIAGTNVTMPTTAAGTSPLAYQWFFNNALLPGATTGNLGLSNVQPAQAGSYLLVVTNNAGAATSAVAQLTVLVPPSISLQPTNQIVPVGSTINFTVIGAGTAPLNYQWFFNATNQVGADTNVLTLANVQSVQNGSYELIITNPAGSITSTVVTLTAGVPPAILQQPTNITVAQGQNALFNVGALGDPVIAYQWRFKGVPLAGATTGSYTVTGSTASDVGTYDVVVTNPFGSITSSVAQLTVLVPPVITTQPTNQTVLVGTSVSFQVNASGTSPLGFEWWFQGTNSVGSNTNVLTLLDAQVSQAGSYLVVVTNSAGSVTSVVALLTVATAPGITQQPSGLTVVQGQNATFAVGATGDSPMNYLWRLNGNTVASGPSNSFTVLAAAVANAGDYDVVASNPYGSATSAVAHLTVLVPPSIVSGPTNQAVAVGTDAAFQVFALGTGPLSYQWWFDGTNALPTGSNILALAAVQPNQAGVYGVVITNLAGSITSVLATLTVGIPPAISESPTNVTAIQGQPAVLNVAATGSSPLTYQWRLNGAAILAATADAYTIASASTASEGFYDAIASNAYGSVTSAVARLTVLVPPSITQDLTNQTAVLGHDVSFEVAVSGTGPIGYQWFFNQTNILKVDTNVLSLSNVQSADAGQYFVVATNSAGAVTSAVAVLNLILPPTITRQPTNQTVLPGATVSFFTDSAGSVPLSPQWTYNGAFLAGATNLTLSLTNVQATQMGGYALIVTNLGGSVTSSVAQLTVLISPSIIVPVSVGASFTAQIPSIDGLSYVLEYKNNLTDPSWTPVTTPVPGTGGILVLQDANPPTTSRFYRVQCQ